MYIISAQRLRNLTTSRLHTDIRHVHEDLCRIFGVDWLMTHMLPRALRAVKPWLREALPQERLWDGEHDPSHEGEFALRAQTEEELDGIWRRFRGS